MKFIFDIFMIYRHKIHS